MPLGRKAWLFCGSDRGGQRAAILYTLIQTARLSDVDPQASPTSSPASPITPPPGSTSCSPGTGDSHRPRSPPDGTGQQGPLGEDARARRTRPCTDEDWLAELANGMDREDGLIWVYGIDDEDGTMAFTDIGVENLAILIADLASSRSRQHDGS